MKSIDVLFRMEGTRPVAVFPSLPGTPDSGTALCYAHVGQHSACTRDWYRTTRAATPKEYAPLLRELTRIYRRPPDPVALKVRQRWTVRHDVLRWETIK
jgi:hypothetical protein